MVDKDIFDMNDNKIGYWRKLEDGKDGKNLYLYSSVLTYLAPENHLLWYYNVHHKYPLCNRVFLLLSYLRYISYS